MLSHARRKREGRGKGFFCPRLTHARAHESEGEGETENSCSSPCMYACVWEEEEDSCGRVASFQAFDRN